MESILKEIGVVKVVETPNSVDPIFLSPSTTESGAKVKIGLTGKDFDRWFVGGVSELKYSILTKPSANHEILTRLGDKAITTLSNLAYLLSLHANGNNEVLLTEMYANIFYIRDQQDIIRAVSIYQNRLPCHWILYPVAITDSYKWSAGHRVFSRN